MSDSNQRQIFKYPRNPFMLGKGASFIIPVLLIFLWFVGQNMQALGLLAQATLPGIIGIPASLFYTLITSIIATASVYYLSVKWGKTFAKRAEEHFGGDDK